MNRIEVLTASVPDRDSLVVELWMEGRYLGEVFRDHNDELRVEWYVHDGRFPDVPLQELMTALREAQGRLSGEAESRR